MPTQVIMPQLGESVDEGTITRWLKAKGEAVKENEALLEVNTDKVDTEIPSPASGVLLDILVEEGTTVRAGAVLALIGAPEEADSLIVKIPQPLTSHAEAPEKVDKTPIPAGTGLTPRFGPHKELGFISPVVARMAAENQLDLRDIPGSGLNGRITKQDVLAYLEGRSGQIGSAPASQVIEPPTGKIEQRDMNIPVASSPYAPFSLPGDEILPFTPVRRAVAEHMVFSRRTSPHVTTVVEADLSQVIAHRQTHKEAFERDGVNLTFTAYFVAAAVAALRTFPVVNSSWSEQGIILHHGINISMATSLGEGGLIVPVIKGAESLSLLGLARAINDLAARARARQLKPDEVKGGTFTITNHGITGSLFAMPIINQPQCAILGVGAIQKRVVVISDTHGGDAIAVRPMVYLSLTFDHRILDGALADQFLAKVVELLGSW